VGSGGSRKTSRLLSNWRRVGSIRPSTVIGEAEFIRSLTSILNVKPRFVRCSCQPMVCQLASKASTGSNSTSRGSGS
jgi:hypothetical protein